MAAMAPETSPQPVELAWEQHGSGPPLVLIHGITEDRRSWSPLLDELAATFTVVAVDLRGHGDSPLDGPFDLGTLAGDVRAVVDHLALDPPLLVGHSLGGTVASAYAAAFPSFGVINVDQSLDLAAFQAQVREAEPLLRSEAYTEVVRQLFATMRGPLSPSETERVESLRQPRQEVLLGVWAPVLDLTPEDLTAMVDQVASAIEVPYLAIHGIDPGPGYADWLTQRLPQAEVEVWEDHGHYPHLVDPERFIERVRRFAVGE